MFFLGNESPTGGVFRNLIRRVGYISGVPVVSKVIKCSIFFHMKISRPTIFSPPNCGVGGFEGSGGVRASSSSVAA